MEHNIKAYVEKLFEQAPRTRRAHELKIKLTRSLLDKYHALLKEGKSPEDAYQLTVYSIGDVQELFKGLEDGPALSQPVYYSQMGGTKKRALPVKKKAAFTLAACFIAALFLIITLVIGMKNDGFGIFALKRVEGETVPAGEGEEYVSTWDPNEIGVSGLDVEWVNGLVDVKVGSGRVIRVTEHSSQPLSEDERLSMSISGDTLKIKWRDQIINFSLFENTYRDVTVEVPREVAAALSELSCSTASGDIRVSGFTAEETDLSTASGSIELSGLTGEEVEVSTASGAIELSDVTVSGTLEAHTTSGIMRFDRVNAENTELSTVSGSVAYQGGAKEITASSVSALIRAELDRCPDLAELSAVSGSLVLAIPECDGFDVDYNSVSGSFFSDFPVTGAVGKSGRGLYGTGKASFRFSTTSGDMSVEKLG